jgi:hypothetical protein
MRFSIQSPRLGLAKIPRRFQREVLSAEAFQSKLHIHKAAFEQEADSCTLAPSADAGPITADPTVCHAAADVHQQEPTPMPRLPDDQQCTAVPPQLKLGSNLTPDHRDRVLGVLAKHLHAFSRDASDLGPVKGVYHRIDIGIHAPIRRPGRRLSPFKEGEISRQMAPMEELNVIRLSTSAFAASVVLARKKSGARRFCVAYRALNAATVPNRYPIPRIDSIFAKLGPAWFLTTLDAQAGYWQISMHSDDVHKTTFLTYGGLRKFLRMLFGLTGAPGTY